MVTVGRDGATLKGLTLPRSDMVPRCCDNGRPVVTDPHTGQTICSCQYGSGLLAYPRVPTLGDAVYGTSAAYAAAAAAQSYVPLGADGSAFYSPLTSTQYDSAKEAVEGWRHLAHTGGMYFPYDTSMAAYSYGAGFGPMDLNAARRKNATKEATNTLKAWLYEHRKNPYPTKGEKIMLAIITKMTLTQVSTWFANARRRLKKENKMTWSPRNRSDDDGDDFDDLGDDDKDGDEREKMDGGSPGRSTPQSPTNMGRTQTDKLGSIDIGESSDDHVTVDDLPASPLTSKPATKERHFSTESQTVNEENQLDNESSLSSASPSFSPSLRDMCSPRNSMDKVSSNSNKSESLASNSESSTRPKIWSVSQFLPTNTSDNHRSRESAVTSALSLSTSHPYHMTSSPAHKGLKSPGQNHSYLSSISSHTNYSSPLSYVTHPLPITLGNNGLPFPYSLPSVKSTLSSPSTTVSRHEAMLVSASSSLRHSVDIQRELSRQAGALDMRNTSPIS